MSFNGSESSAEKWGRPQVQDIKLTTEQEITLIGAFYDKYQGVEFKIYSDSKNEILTVRLHDDREHFINAARAGYIAFDHTYEGQEMWGRKPVSNFIKNNPEYSSELSFLMK
jgi:hypothetical protein